MSACLRAAATFCRRLMRGAAPAAGSFCAAPYLFDQCAAGGAGCGVSAPARRVPFRMHEKEPKVHL